MCGCNVLYLLLTSQLLLLTVQIFCQEDRLLTFSGFKELRYLLTKCPLMLNTSLMLHLLHTQRYLHATVERRGICLHSSFHQSSGNSSISYTVLTLSLNDLGVVSQDMQTVPITGAARVYTVQIFNRANNHVMAVFIVYQLLFPDGRSFIANSTFNGCAAQI